MGDTRTRYVSETDDISQIYISSDQLLDWGLYGMNISANNITHFRFAGNIVTMVESQEDVSKMLRELKTDSRQVGLTMNRLAKDHAECPYLIYINPEYGNR